MTTRQRFVLAAVGAALIGLGAGWWVGQVWYGTDPSTDNASTIADQFVDGNFSDLDGKPHRLSEWRGKPIVLNFWATWCPPCRDEIPLFVDLQRRYDTRVQFIGLALEEPEPVAAFVQKYGVNYPVLVAPGADGFALMDRYGNSRNALPFTVILNADGRVVERRAGAYRQDHLESTLRALIAKPDATSPAKLKK